MPRKSYRRKPRGRPRRVRRTKKSYKKKRVKTAIGTTKRRKTMAFSTGTPGTLDIPNHVLMLSKFRPVFTQVLTLFPEIPVLIGGNGAISKTFWANCPNFVMYPPPYISDWNLGYVGISSGSAPEDTGGAVIDNTIPMQYFRNCMVTSSTIELILTPAEPLVTETVDYNFADRALCALTCSPSWTPHQSGSGVGNINDAQHIRDYRNTITATTEYIEGAKTTSAVLKHTFYPKLLFPVTDILDAEGRFNNQLGSIYSTSPVKACADGAFWNLTILPDAPQIVSYASLPPYAPTFGIGIPRPHSVQVKITYNVKYSQPFGPNIPLGP